MSIKDSHHSIYLLPNLFTTASLFFAFYSIVASLKGHYEAAVVAIFIGMIADGLDGRIARLTNTQSAFGAQYDSLSDMVTFGVAPALLLYSWILHSMGKIGWLVSFMFTASAALRLARFNTHVEDKDKRYFQGLSSPTSSAVVTSFAWMCHQYQFNNGFVMILTAIITVIMAVLMISNIRYYSFKDLDFKGKVPFLYLVIMVILFIAIAVNPAVVLFLGFSAYALSGPIHMILHTYRDNNDET